MANINFADRENACLNPAAPKMRQRLQSAPAMTKTTPLPSGRKAFGTVNQKVSTPAVNVQDKKLLKPQETKVKSFPQKQVEKYPEIEKFIPYDPLEFEKYGVPEDLIPLSCLALPGLASLPRAPHPSQEDSDMLIPLQNMSPLKLPESSDYRCSELDDFLQTLDQLTIELPPEAD